MAKLPREIQKQVDAVDAMYQQPEAPAAEDTPAPAPAETPEPAPETPETPETPAEPQSDAPAEPAAPAVQSDAAVWEQRYKTLQGMHNQNMADMKHRLELALADKQTLTEKLAERDAAPPAQPQPDVDPKLVEEYGEDMVRFVRAVVHAEMKQSKGDDGVVRALGDEVKTVKQTVAKTAYELFLDRLGVRVPDLLKINSDPRFLAWLGEVDPVYGEPRQAALNRASAAQNVEQAANVFKAFLQTVEAAPAPAASQPNPQLAKQAAPRAGPAPIPTARQPAAALVSSAEVTQFYDDVRRGHYRGREEERVRREQEINKALAEGRITP